MPEPIFKDAKEIPIETWIEFRESLYSGVDRSFHEEEVEIILKDPTKACFFMLLPNQEEVIGMLELSLRSVVDGCLSSPVGYIEGIFIKENGRGKGLGRKMVDFAKDWARKQGCTEMGVDAELHEVEAQKFHERMGFTETYRTVGYRMDL